MPCHAEHILSKDISAIDTQRSLTGLGSSCECRRNSTSSQSGLRSLAVDTKEDKLVHRTIAAAYQDELRGRLLSMSLAFSYYFDSLSVINSVMDKLSAGVG